MSILKRFKDIMSANVNDKLDKARNPEKAAKEFIVELLRDLGQLKKELAPALQLEANTRKSVEACKLQREQYENYAQKALRAGNERDAKIFLTEKVALEKKLSNLENQYELVHKNAEMMRQMHDKLVTDITQVQMRYQMIQSKITVAEATQAMNHIHDQVQSHTKEHRNLDNWETEVDRMLDEANAMAELNQRGQMP